MKKLILFILSIALVNSIVGNVSASIAKQKNDGTKSASEKKKSLNGPCFDPMKGNTCILPTPKPKKKRKS